jgi:hypothetical protein
MSSGSASMEAAQPAALAFALSSSKVFGEAATELANLHLALRRSSSAVDKTATQRLIGLAC